MQEAAHIRWMIRRDMPTVMAIETDSFEFPYTEDEMILMLRNRNVIGMVAEVGEQVVGYMIYELFKERLYIHSLAVASTYRFQKVGTTMLEKLVGKLAPQRRNRIILHVREKNLAAQLFFRASGFRADVDPYFEYQNGESAYRFTYRIHVQQEA